MRNVAGQQAAVTNLKFGEFPQRQNYMAPDISFVHQRNPQPTNENQWDSHWRIPVFRSRPSSCTVGYGSSFPQFEEEKNPPPKVFVIIKCYFFLIIMTETLKTWRNVLTVVRQYLLIMMINRSHRSQEVWLSISKLRLASHDYEYLLTMRNFLIKLLSKTKS